MANEYLILGLSISIMFNVVWFLILLGTGWGKQIVKRWWRAKTYKKGEHVNTFFITNNNVAKEIYTKKKSDGSFEIGKYKYAVNPKLSVVYEGIPTQFNLEGISEPIGFHENDHSEKMSTAEIKKIITNNRNQDFRDSILKYLPYALIITVLLLGLAVWAGYANWRVYDVLVQGGSGTIMGR